MDLGRAQQFLKEKTILVTGATGFLAKVFVEKVLRIQPNINKMYLLLRASNSELAAQRLQNEVIQTELFKVLRDEWGEEFDNFISEKIVVIAGDVSLQNLGVNDSNLQNEMLESIDIIVNFAASTKFDERFDIAMGVNTMGALQVLNFAKNCHRIQLLLHVSTAYVCGEANDKKVIVREEPFEMGKTLKGTSKLDIYAEKAFAKTKIAELQAENASEKTIAFSMKDYGVERAKMYGWPNTYVFTKAMGEMLLMHHKEKIPLIIIRPTMVTSTYNDPFPGWIEGFRTIDSVIGAYGKGKITCFLGNPNTILDTVPADMVINCVITAIVTHSNQNDMKNFIYHIASSSINPLTISNTCDILYSYFTKNPCTNEKGKPIIVSSKLKVLTSMVVFKGYIMIRYLLPLKVLYLVNKVFSLRFQDTYADNLKKVKMMVRMVELYKPYVLLKAIFDDTNTECLRRATKGHNKVERIGLDFDPKNIDWTDYMMNVHIPGLFKYAFKQQKATKML